MAGRNKNKLIIFCFFLITSVHFELWLFWGWERRHTHGGGGLRGYEGQMCLCGSRRFCFQVDMETVLASAIFARAVLLLLRLLPWIELKSSRLREGIGRVGKIIGSSAYIFILFLFDFNSRLWHSRADYQTRRGGVAQFVGKCQITWQQSGPIFTVLWDLFKLFPKSIWTIVTGFHYSVGGEKKMKYKKVFFFWV